MALRFDSEGAYRFLHEMILKAADLSAERFVKSSTEGLSGAAKAGTQKRIEDTAEAIKWIVEFNADAIVESYGTGTLADTGPDSYWNQYKGNSAFWNPARFGKRIVGRPPGAYTDLWGRKRVSSGRFEGRPLIVSNGKGKVGKLFTVREYFPMRTIQNAERWLLHGGEIDRLVQSAVDVYLSRLDQFFVEV